MTERRLTNPSSFTRTTSSISTVHSASSSTIFQYPGFHEETPTFKVLIVGAGIGGLMLGLCLERAGIDYVILERMHDLLDAPRSTVKLAANTLGVVEQLGLLDEVMKIAMPISGLTLRKHNMSAVGKIDFSFHKERHGHYSFIVQRTELCQLLISRMRNDRIQWGRKVLEIVSGNAGVQCRCANGHVVQGDVLVGADGAHSAVRQNLFKTLKSKSLLPKQDMESLKFSQNALNGLTNPLDPARFPDVAKTFCEVHIIIGKDSPSPHTMWLSAVSGNRITWCVTGPLLTCNKSEQNFMVSQYGPEEVDKACQLIEDLETPFGGKLGDLIAETPRENITKILVEEKHYKTWYHGRTVLIGEACHKFVSFAGQGAEQAILDAVCLANLFSKIQSPYPLEAIVEAFEAYQETRLPLIKICMQSAGQTAKALNDQGLASDMKRRILFNLPLWMRVMSVDKTQVRPQLEFLPFVPDRGSRSIRTASLKSV